MALLFTKRAQFASHLALVLALLVVAVVRLWRLHVAGPPDYDSVSNWQTVMALAHGNGKLLFHHAAPGFYLLFVPVVWVTQEFRVFQLLNVLVGVLSLGVFGHFVSRAGKLGPLATASIVLLAGTSLLLTFSGRDFLENAGALGLASGLMGSYYERLHTHQPRALLRAAAWAAAGLCMSFKVLFLLPILVVLEWWAADGLLWQQGTWWRVTLILAAPYVVLGAAGVALGLPWYRWLAIYYRNVVPEGTNLAGNHDKVHFEPLFYVRYLLRFEPGLLLGLALGAWAWRGQQHWHRGQALTLGPYLLIWAVLLLLGLSVLAKAPRGLLFAYAPLAALLVLSGRQLFGARVAYPLLLVVLVFNLFILQRELYSRLPTHYPQVAAWLRTHQGQRIISAVGIGLKPFLMPNQSLITIADERQLAALRQQGYQYMLLDGYWRVAGVLHFDSLQRQRPVAAWPEPQLTAPLLFLEHAEYTGLSYDQTMQAQQAAAHDSLQLRLYRL